ncbi:MAG: deoxyribodipyrimidine photo-lyase [Armatimonadota bacterium]
MSDVIYNKRETILNSSLVDDNGSCVIYWMQRSQRADNNLALDYAISAANSLNKPLIVYFGIYDKFPMASVRAFKFMLEGLFETFNTLSDMGIGVALRRENPWEGIVSLAKKLKAALVVVDEDYLKVGRSWRRQAAENINCRFIQIDADTVVPVRNSDKEEWGAYTIRPKILKVLDSYLIPQNSITPNIKWKSKIDNCLDYDNKESFINLAYQLDVDQSVSALDNFIGGYSEAIKRMEIFISERLPYYDKRNEIGINVQSDISPYLHFGQISPLKCALMASDADATKDNIDGFLEQLIVRRELAINFCFYSDLYDSLAGAPEWAMKTIKEHQYDPREQLYTLDELENAQTHDDLWNTAQTELVKYGKMHGYMRMVWAKSILEWSTSFEEALQRAIYLNDKYLLDGRDANGYTNIAWCIYGKHDRPFANRPIFGKIRYMTTSATKRKTDWIAYMERVLNSSLDIS